MVGSPAWAATAYRLFRREHWSPVAIAELLQAEGWDVSVLEVAALVDEHAGRELRRWLAERRS